MTRQHPERNRRGRGRDRGRGGEGLRWGGQREREAVPPHTTNNTYLRFGEHAGAPESPGSLERRRRRRRRKQLVHSSSLFRVLGAPPRRHSYPPSLWLVHSLTHSFARSHTPPPPPPLSRACAHCLALALSLSRSLTLALALSLFLSGALSTQQTPMSQMRAARISTPSLPHLSLPHLCHSNKYLGNRLII